MLSGICSVLFEVISEIRDVLVMQSRNEEESQAGFLVRTVTNAVVSHRVQNDVVSLLQKLNSDLHASMQDQMQHRSLNKIREAELNALRHQSSILCEQLQSIHGGVSPINIRSPMTAGRSPFIGSMTPRAD